MRMLAFGAEKKAFADQTLTFDIKDPEGTLVYRSSQTTSRYGIASADWQIPANLRLGEYRIEAEFDDASAGSTYRASVKISRYELPTFSVAVKPDHAYYLPGQNASVEVRANYLYGEPVRRGHVRVVRETDREWDFREQKWKIEAAETYEGRQNGRARKVCRSSGSGEGARRLWGQAGGPSLEYAFMFCARRRSRTLLEVSSEYHEGAYV